MWYAGFALGLASGLHCIGMCGPLHLVLAGRQKSPNKFVLGRVVFNLGRIGTYTILGLAAGLLGQAGGLFMPKQAIAIGAGVLMIALMVWPRALDAIRMRLPFQQLGQPIWALISRSSLLGQTFMGMLNGLLPCGAVYLALAGSLAMPSLAESVAFMGAFGAATLPFLLSVSLSGKSLQALALRVPHLQTALGVSVAIFLIARGVWPSETGEGANCHSGPAPHASKTIICRKL